MHYEFQSTFLDNSISVEHARKYGHTHLSEVFYLPTIWDISKLLFEIFQTCLLKSQMSNTFLSTQVASHSDKLGNKAILLIHFSARYTLEVGWYPNHCFSSIYLNATIVSFIYLLFPIWLLLFVYYILIPFIFSPLGMTKHRNTWDPKVLSLLKPGSHSDNLCIYI
jgi:hypothetical protein